MYNFLENVWVGPISLSWMLVLVSRQSISWLKDGQRVSIVTTRLQELPSTKRELNICLTVTFQRGMPLLMLNMLQLQCHKFRPVKVEVHYHSKHWPILGFSVNGFFSSQSRGPSGLVFTCSSRLFWLPLASWQCQQRRPTLLLLHLAEADEEAGSAEISAPIRAPWTPVPGACGTNICRIVSSNPTFLNREHTWHSLRGATGR